MLKEVSFYAKKYYFDGIPIVVMASDGMYQAWREVDGFSYSVANAIMTMPMDEFSYEEFLENTEAILESGHYSRVEDVISPLSRVEQKVVKAGERLEALGLL